MMLAGLLVESSPGRWHMVRGFPALILQVHRLTSIGACQVQHCEMGNVSAGACYN